MKKVRNVVFVFGLALALAGCTSAPPQTALPKLGFEQVAPVSLNVSKIEVYSEYIPPAKAPNVDHVLDTPPEQAVRDLVAKQLKADGPDNILRVFIDDASIVRRDLPVRNDFRGLFVEEVSEVYDAKMVLRFELASEDAPDIVIGRASVIADRQKSLLEGLSPAERDRALFALVEELMLDVSDGFSSIVQRTFGFN